MAPGDASRSVSAEDRQITLHGPDQFEAMRRAGRLAAETLDYITPEVRPGVTTGQLLASVVTTSGH